MKTLLIDEAGSVVGGVTEFYPFETPKPLWSEQDPAHWWKATCVSIKRVLDENQVSAVDVVGLMAMSRLDPDPEASRSTFRELARIRDESNAGAWYREPLPHLSMGMSGDFEQAIALGATHVRVGSAIFGERVKPQE